MLVADPRELVRKPTGRDREADPVACLVSKQVVRRSKQECPGIANLSRAVEWKAIEQSALAVRTDFAPEGQSEHAERRRAALL